MCIYGVHCFSVSTILPHEFGHGRHGLLNSVLSKLINDFDLLTSLLLSTHLRCWLNLVGVYFETESQPLSFMGD